MTLTVPYHEIFFEVIQEGIGMVAQGTFTDTMFTTGMVGLYTRSRRADFADIVCVD